MLSLTCYFLKKEVVKPSKAVRQGEEAVKMALVEEPHLFI